MIYGPDVPQCSRCGLLARDVVGTCPTEERCRRVKAGEPLGGPPLQLIPARITPDKENSDMDSGLRLALIVRCRGRCECGCGARTPPGEVDHFFGRAKAEESEATCWVLSVDCHRQKTDNKPSADDWLQRFIAHAERHGYAESKQRAETTLEWRRALTAGTKVV